MTEIPKCVSCGRRPSERLGRTVRGVRRTKPHRPCHDPIHDLADLGPAAVALLRDLHHGPSSCGLNSDHELIQRRIDALLAAAPEVKPTRPNHADGCTMQRWRYLGTGYDRVRKCECGAEDHAPEVKP